MIRQKCSPSKVSERDAKWDKCEIVDHGASSFDRDVQSHLPSAFPLHADVDSFRQRTYGRDFAPTSITRKIRRRHLVSGFDAYPLAKVNIFPVVTEI